MNHTSISVVISTCDRANLLAKCLQALKYQIYSNFEVIVVCGPCSDDTADVLAPYEAAQAIRVLNCEDKNLSKSRNMGINAAAGEVIAFIDDDSIAHPRWLAELADGYRDPDVAGVGGLVYDYSGRQLQYRFSSCFRNGQTKFDVVPPLDPYSVKGANPFLYLQGTNASFRRSCLVDVGGFSEDFPYFHDETDLCLHLIDSGYRLLSVENAAVYHKYAKSGIRNDQRMYTDPYLPVRSQCIFGQRNGQGVYSNTEILQALQEFTRAVKEGGWHAYLRKDFTNAQLYFYLEQVDKGQADGLALGNTVRRATKFAAPDEAFFRKFPIKLPADRLKVCFLSQEFPPIDYGGIGRFTHDLARGFAEAGHEVHVITNSLSQESTDFEQGIWVHRLSPGNFPAPSMEGQHLYHNYQLAARNYAEVCRIHEDSPIDIVSAPLWNCESAIVAGDPRFATVLTLMTSFKTVHDIHPTIRDLPNVGQMMDFEVATYQVHKYVHAISRDILKKSQADFGTASHARVVQLGVQDFTPTVQRLRSDEKIRVLFVGRLERRKGIDLLLDAARKLLPERPNLEFVLVGKDSPHTELGGVTYREAFQAEVSLNPCLARVIFTGPLSEQELQQHYADADIFCLPSRYESYGLVLLEAMAFGVPVLANNVGGMIEIVEHNINGLLCNVENVDEFLRTLSALIDGHSLRTKMGHAARKSFEQKYSARVAAANTIEYYRSVALEHRNILGNAAGSKLAAFEAAKKNFAKVVERSSGVDPDRSARIAEELIGAACGLSISAPSGPSISAPSGPSISAPLVSPPPGSPIRLLARRLFRLLSPKLRARVNVIRGRIWRFRYHLIQGIKGY